MSRSLLGDSQTSPNWGCRARTTSEDVKGSHNVLKTKKAASKKTASKKTAPNQATFDKATFDKATELRDDRGSVTAEYAIATMAAVGFAGLLVVILRGDEVRAFLTDIVHSALTYAG